ncbi:MAG: EamA family transporter [Chloroflexota bacterium]|nr:EamA family transporter [Chloroflexota bacterium]
MRTTTASQHAPGWLIWSALLVVYLVWGSTYLAIAIVVETMPPLLAAGGRFLFAGLLIWVTLAVVRGRSGLKLTRGQLVGSTFVGVALLLGGNGMVMLGQRTVPSGLAALIIAVVPLWVVVLRLLSSEPIRRGTLVGVVVGFAGVALLVAARGIAGDVDVVGMLLLVMAGASWSVGSYYSRRVALPADPFAASAAQLVLGGVALLGAGVLTGELGWVAPEEFSAASLVALLYLVFFGSILAYSAYTWLLQNAPVSKVATYAYINPVVAIVLGWLVLNEEFTLAMAVGGAMIVLAVGLVIRTESRPARAGALESPPAQSALGRLRGAK